MDLQVTIIVQVQIIEFWGSHSKQSKDKTDELIHSFTEHFH